jgi:hypothetical protein
LHVHRLILSAESGAPIAERYIIAAHNWGVIGSTQTVYNFVYSERMAAVSLFNPSNQGGRG